MLRNLIKVWPSKKINEYGFLNIFIHSYFKHFPHITRMKASISSKEQKKLIFNTKWIKDILAKYPKRKRKKDIKIEDIKNDEKNIK